MKVLRYASLVLAIAGMAILYLMASCERAQFVGIGDLTPALNSASVRVTGIVTAGTRTNRTGSAYLSFILSDGTNRLTITAFNRCARDLVATGPLPRKGDRVEASGTVRIRSPGDASLVLESPEQLKVVGKGRS